MKTEKNNLQTKTWPVRGHNTFRLQLKDVERPTGRSMTIQDDAYSVRDIMEKFTIQGESWEQRQGLYQDEVSHESQDLRQVIAMDLVDRDELLSTAQIQAHQASKKLAEYKRLIDEENALKVKEQAEKDLQKGSDESSQERPKSRSIKAKNEDD